MAQNTPVKYYIYLVFKYMLWYLQVLTGSLGSGTYSSYRFRDGTYRFFREVRPSKIPAGNDMMLFL
jgi:hypothetical protein